LSKSPEVVEQVTFEISQIDTLLKTYSDLLMQVEHRTPNTVEIAAVASVIHSFYNGLENIFLSIAKQIDGQVPSGGESHRKVLTQMTRANRKRNSVLSKETATILEDYLAFRHFYRHSYTFIIDWNKLRELVIPLDQNWSQIKAELQKFSTNLKSGIKNQK